MLLREVFPTFGELEQVLSRQGADDDIEFYRVFYEHEERLLKFSHLGLYVEDGKIYGVAHHSHDLVEEAVERKLKSEKAQLYIFPINQAQTMFDSRVN